MKSKRPLEETDWDLVKGTKDEKGDILNKGQNEN